MYDACWLFHSEFDKFYTQRGHGRTLRENGTKLTTEDQNADLDVHERIVFCHILDMRENLEKYKAGLGGQIMGSASELTPPDSDEESQQQVLQPQKRTHRTLHQHYDSADDG